MRTSAHVPPQPGQAPPLMVDWPCSRCMCIVCMCAAHALGSRVAAPCCSLPCCVPFPPRGGGARAQAARTRARVRPTALTFVCVFAWLLQATGLRTHSRLSHLNRNAAAGSGAEHHPCAPDQPALLLPEGAKWSHDVMPAGGACGRVHVMGTQANAGWRPLCPHACSHAGMHDCAAA